MTRAKSFLDDEAKVDNEEGESAAGSEEEDNEEVGGGPPYTQEEEMTEEDKKFINDDDDDGEDDDVDEAVISKELARIKEGFKLRKPALLEDKASLTPERATKLER